jgi:MFS family permease
LVSIGSVFVGTHVDYVGGKFAWTALTCIAGGGMFLSAALGSNYVWIIGLIASIVATIASELVVIPRQSYLDEIEPRLEGETKLAAMAKVSSMRIFFSYFAQFIFTASSVGILMGVGGQVVPAQIVIVFCGVWYCTGTLFIIRKFPSRKARRELPGKQSVLGISFSDLCNNFKELRTRYPEAMKYLLFLALCQNGLGTTTLNIATPYLLEGPPKATSLQLQLVFACVLIFGMPWVKLFSKLTLRIGYKKLLFIVMLVNIVAILIIGCVITRPLNGFGGRFLLLIGITVVFIAPALTWWYSIYWPAFLALVPEDKVGQYAGVFTFVRVIALIWHSGPIYASCVMALSSANDGHRLGVLSMIASQRTACGLCLEPRRG